MITFYWILIGAIIFLCSILWISIVLAMCANTYLKTKFVSKCLERKENKDET